MFRRVLGAGLIAGIGVGLLIALIQHLTLVPLIVRAEVYEQHLVAAQQHVHLRQDGENLQPLAADATRLAGATDPHTDLIPLQASEPPLTRAALTWTTTTLTTVGFAFLLAGLFAVTGRDVDGREGLLWGLAGFAAFTLAPSFGLPPELPGSIAADLASRQIWWIGTAVATLVGLGLLAFMRDYRAVIGGIVLLMAPHIIGAPHPYDRTGVVPAELAALFASRSLCVNALLWILLGISTGVLYRRRLRAST